MTCSVLHFCIVCMSATLGTHGPMVTEVGSELILIVRLWKSVYQCSRQRAAAQAPQYFRAELSGSP